MNNYLMKLTDDQIYIFNFLTSIEKSPYNIIPIVRIHNSETPQDYNTASNTILYFGNFDLTCGLGVTDPSNAGLEILNPEGTSSAQFIKGNTLPVTESGFYDVIHLSKIMFKACFNIVNNASLDIKFTGYKIFLAE